MNYDRSAPVWQSARLLAAMYLATSSRLSALHRFVPRVAGRANLPADGADL